MNGDETLRDALRDDAKGGAASSDAWDQVRARAGSIRHRRQTAQRAIGGLTAAAMVAAVLVAAGAFDRGKNVVATPPSTGERIAIARLGEDRVEIVSADDGRVLEVVLDGDDASGVTGIASTPDGAALLVSRTAQTEALCPNNAPFPELVRVDIATGATERIVGGGTHPVVSPDGEWVAYAMQDSCIGGFLGVTNLRTGENYRPIDHLEDPVPAMPVAWSPNSREVLYRIGDPVDVRYAFAVANPCCDTEPVEGQLPLGTSAAAYTTPDAQGFRRFVAAVPTSPSTYEVVVTGAGGERLFEVADATALPASQLSVNTAGHVLVMESEGRTVAWRPGEQQVTVLAAHAVGATWLPTQQSTPPEPTNTTSTSQALSVVAPNNLVVVTNDNRLMVIDAQGNVQRVIQDDASAGYQRVQNAPDGVTLYYDQSNDPCGDAGGGPVLEHSVSTVRIDLDPGQFGHFAAGAFVALSPDGTQLAYRHGTCGADGRLVVMDLATSEERTFSLTQPSDGGPAAELVGPVAWDADNQHLMLRVNREPGTEFWYVDTATEAATITGSTYRARGEQGAEIGPTSFAPLGTTGRWAAVYVNVGGSSLVEYDLATDSTVGPLAELPTSGVTIVGSDPTGQHLLLLVSSGASSDLYRWTEGDAVLTFVAPGITAADW